MLTCALDIQASQSSQAWIRAQNRDDLQHIEDIAMLHRRGLSYTMQFVVANSQTYAASKTHGINWQTLD